MRKIILFFLVSLQFISCSVNPYIWIDSNKSIPNAPFLEKSFSIDGVVDNRKKTEWPSKYNKLLIESIKMEFQKELSRHFIINDTINSDLKIKFEIQEFSYFNNESWKKDKTVYWLLSAGLIAAEISYLSTIETEYFNGEEIKTNEDKTLKGVFIGAGVIWVANAVRMIRKTLKGAYLRENHKIKLLASLYDNKNNFISSYEGAASGKFNRKNKTSSREYSNEINGSLSDVFNQIIKQIYDDEDMIKTHFELN